MTKPNVDQIDVYVRLMFLYLSDTHLTVSRKRNK